MYMRVCVCVCTCVCACVCVCLCVCVCACVYMGVHIRLRVTSFLGGVGGLSLTAVSQPSSAGESQCHSTLMQIISWLKWSQCDSVSTNVDISRTMQPVES